MLITEHPPFLRFPLPYKISKIYAPRLIQKSQTVGPVVEAQLQRGLTGKTVGQKFADFLFWDRQPLNAKREKSFTPYAAVVPGRDSGVPSPFSAFSMRPREPNS